MRILLLLLIPVICFSSLGRADEDWGFSHVSYDKSANSIARESCQTLLVAANAEYPARHATESVRAQAGAALLMLIFEHPSLRAAAHRVTTTEKDRYVLFHLSGAFALKPKAILGSFETDLTNFTKNVKEPWPKWISYFVSGNTLLENLRLPIASARLTLGPKGPRELWKKQLAEILVEAMTEQWILPGPDGWNGFRAQNFSFSRPLLSRAGTAFNKISVRVRKLGALNSYETADIGNVVRNLQPQIVEGREAMGLVPVGYEDAEKERAQKVRELVVEFLVDHGEDFLKVRDEILADAITNGRGIYEALLNESPNRSRLRDQILRFARGENPIPDEQGLGPEGEPTAPLNLPAPAVSVKVETESLAQVAALFALAEQKPELRWANDPLILPSKVLMASDVALAQLGPRENFSDLRKVMPPAAQLASGLTEVMAYVNVLSEKAEVDLENLEGVHELLQVLAMKSALRLQDYVAYLAQKNMSESKMHMRLDEADLVRTTLVQTVSSLELQIEHQIRWKSLLTQLQASLRNFRQQQALGADTSSLAQQIVDGVMRGAE